MRALRSRRRRPARRRRAASARSLARSRWISRQEECTICAAGSRSYHDPSLSSSRHTRRQLHRTRSLRGGGALLTPGARAAPAMVCSIGSWSTGKRACAARKKGELRDDAWRREGDDDRKKGGGGGGEREEGRLLLSQGRVQADATRGDDREGRRRICRKVREG
jgi:hypothetical protein